MESDLGKAVDWTIQWDMLPNDSKGRLDAQASGALTDAGKQDIFWSVTFRLLTILN